MDKGNGGGGELVHAVVVGPCRACASLCRVCTVAHTCPRCTVTSFQVVAHLLIPFTLVWIIVFFILFECILNAIAELTFFDDREFYQDWWNSTTFDEFARKVRAPCAGSLFLGLLAGGMPRSLAPMSFHLPRALLLLCMLAHGFPLSVACSCDGHGSGTDRCTSSC